MVILQEKGRVLSGSTLPMSSRSPAFALHAGETDGRPTATGGGCDTAMPVAVEPKLLMLKSLTMVAAGGTSLFGSAGRLHST